VTRKLSVSLCVFITPLQSQSWTFFEAHRSYWITCESSRVILLSVGNWRILRVILLSVDGIRLHDWTCSSGARIRANDIALLKVLICVPRCRTESQARQSCCFSDLPQSSVPHGSLLFIVTVAQIANRKRSGNLRLSPCFTLRTMKRVASATTLVDTSIFTTTSTKRAQIVPCFPVSSVSRLSESIASFRQVGFTGLLSPKIWRGDLESRRGVGPKWIEIAPRTTHSWGAVLAPWCSN
jgi:hypothetical protein